MLNRFVANWKVGTFHAGRNFRKIKSHVAVHNENGLLIAVTGPAGDPASIVDATLISAAPDLVQFAKNVAAYLGGLGTSRDDAECALLNHAERVILKAGEHLT